MTSHLRHLIPIYICIFVLACGRTAPVSLAGGGIGGDPNDPSDPGYWNKYNDKTDPGYIPPTVKDPIKLGDEPPPDDSQCTAQGDGTTQCQLPPGYSPDQINPQEGRNTLARLLSLIQGFKGGSTPQDGQMMNLLNQYKGQLQQNPQSKQAFGEALFGMLVQKSCAKGAQQSDKQPTQMMGAVSKASGGKSRGGKKMSIGQCFMQTMQKLGPKLKNIVKNLNGTALKLLKKQAM